jgi:hypothetical protein
LKPCEANFPILKKKKNMIFEQFECFESASGKNLALKKPLRKYENGLRKPHENI